MSVTSGRVWPRAGGFSAEDAQALSDGKVTSSASHQGQAMGPGTSSVIATRRKGHIFLSSQGLGVLVQALIVQKRKKKQRVGGEEEGRNEKGQKIKKKKKRSQ